MKTCGVSWIAAMLGGAIGGERANRACEWWTARHRPPLEALPLYDGIARMKSHAHWQTDVLAGWAIGSAFGYYATTRAEPFFVSVLPREVSAEVRMKF